MTAPTGSAMWKLLTVADGGGTITSSTLYYSPCGSLWSWSGGAIGTTQGPSDVSFVSPASGSWKCSESYISLYTSTIDSIHSWTTCTATVAYTSIPAYEDSVAIIINNYTDLVPSGGGNVFFLWMGDFAPTASFHPATPGGGLGGVIDTGIVIDALPFSETVTIPTANGVTEYRKIFIYNSGTATAQNLRVHMYYGVEGVDGPPAFPPVYPFSIAPGTSDDDITNAVGYVYSQPFSRIDGTSLGDLASGSSVSVWARRYISTAFPTGTYPGFQIRFSYNPESSSGTNSLLPIGD